MKDYKQEYLKIDDAVCFSMTNADCIKDNSFNTDWIENAPVIYGHIMESKDGYCIVRVHIVHINVYSATIQLTLCSNKLTKVNDTDVDDYHRNNSAYMNAHIA